jgi:hypothetical protein
MKKLFFLGAVAMASSLFALNVNIDYQNGKFKSVGEVDYNGVKVDVIKKLDLLQDKNIYTAVGGAFSYGKISASGVSDANVYTYTVLARGGYNFNVKNNFTVTPYLQLDYNFQHMSDNSTDIDVRGFGGGLGAIIGINDSHFSGNIAYTYKNLDSSDVRKSVKERVVNIGVGYSF